MCIRQPTPVFLPGESHGQRTLAGYSPRGHKKLDMTERLTLCITGSLCCIPEINKTLLINYHFSSVQSLSCVQLFGTPWTAALQASLSITNSWSCSNSCPSGRWCHPAISSFVVPFSSCLQSFPASGSFQMSQFIKWPKYWSFSFSISPSNEHSGLIPFRMDWLDLLAVQGTLYTPT